MVGERGGQTISFEFAQILHETFKDDWRRKIREAVAESFRIHGEFHVDALAPLDVPADHKNVIGSVIGSLVRDGKIVEVARRRPSAPESHGRKSGVFHLTDLGRQKLAEHLGDIQETPRAADSAEVLPLSPAEPLQLFEAADEPETSHYRSEAA